MKQKSINIVQEGVLLMVKASLARDNAYAQNVFSEKQSDEGGNILHQTLASISRLGLTFLDLITPVWVEERGVFVPLLKTIIQPKDLLGEEGGRYHEWKGANALAKTAGARLFTRDEAYVLLWQKDAINALLEAHGGDALSGIFWTSSEYNETGSWAVDFSTGFVLTNLESGAFVARAVIEP